MRIEDDEKPRVVLQEHKVTNNLPRGSTVFNEPWKLSTFKKRLQVVVVRYPEHEMEFDLIGIHPFLVNTFRRLMLSDVPSMAIEKVHVLNNTSIIQDEILAHRLAMIPFRADPRMFEYKTDASSEHESDTLEFELKIKCTFNKDGNKDSSCVEDMYKNNNVYSRHIKWVPIGNQKDKFSEKEVGPIHDDILIAKLRPGHELDLKLIVVKGVGRDHAKFSPVATAYYRLLPEIFLTRAVEGEDAEKLQKAFTPGVIEIKTDSHRKYAVVENARYDCSSRNVYKFPELKEAVVITKVQDHFIFNVESVGAMKPDVIFKEAVGLLKSKCLSLLEELNSQ